MPSKTVATVIGTGNMGSALARALLDDGHTVTVWNRTETRHEPLRARGAQGAASAADAIRASPVIIVCVLDYKSTHSLLETEDAWGALSGKALLQMSTGSADEARMLDEQARQRGAQPLDGAILAYPSAVGLPDCQVIYSGDRQTFIDLGPLLDTFGAKRHVGDDPGIANIMNAAAVGVLFDVALGAFLEAGAYAEAEGAKLDDLAALLPAVTALLRDAIEAALPQVRTRDYGGHEASIDLFAEAMGQTKQRMAALGCASRLKDALMEYLVAAQERGLGSQEFAALYELMRPDPQLIPPAG